MIIITEDRPVFKSVQERRKTILVWYFEFMSILNVKSVKDGHKKTLPDIFWRNCAVFASKLAKKSQKLAKISVIFTLQHATVEISVKLSSKQKIGRQPIRTQHSIFSYVWLCYAVPKGKTEIYLHFAWCTLYFILSSVCLTNALDALFIFCILDCSVSKDVGFNIKQKTETFCWYLVG